MAALLQFCVRCTEKENRRWSEGGRQQWVSSLSAILQGLPNFGTTNENVEWVSSLSAKMLADSSSAVQTAIDFGVCFGRISVSAVQQITVVLIMSLERSKNFIVRLNDKNFLPGHFQFELFVKEKNYGVISMGVILHLTKEKEKEKYAKMGGEGCSDYVLDSWKELSQGRNNGSLHWLSWSRKLKISSPIPVAYAAQRRPNGGRDMTNVPVAYHQKSVPFGLQRNMKNCHNVSVGPSTASNAGSPLRLLHINLATTDSVLPSSIGSPSSS
nr:hypothetical protein Iba_chr13cCG11220 [Ipomoea batatas]